MRCTEFILDFFVFEGYSEVVYKGCHNRRRLPNALAGVVQLFLLPLVNVPTTTTTPRHRRRRPTRGSTDPSFWSSTTSSCPRQYYSVPQSPLQPPITPSIPPTPNSATPHHQQRKARRLYVVCLHQTTTSRSSHESRAMSPEEARWPTV